MKKISSTFAIFFIFFNPMIALAQQEANCTNGYFSQQSYSGDCVNRPQGTVCLGFPDNYTWLINDSVRSLENDSCNQNEVVIAVGFRSKYHHIIGTNLVCISAINNSGNVCGGSTPIANIKANGSDGPIEIAPSDNLLVTLELDAAASGGAEADWWALANTPSGWRYFDLQQGFSPGFLVSHQGALFDLGSTQVLNTTALELGTHTYYFGVDLVMNGSLDIASAYYDSVEVNVRDETDGSTINPSCELVASVASSDRGFIQISNNLNIAIEAFLPQFAFEAYMRPSECIVIGINSNKVFDVELTRCDVDTEEDCLGPEKFESFSVLQNETHIINVSDNFF
jgi:hypothetical protein